MTREERVVACVVRRGQQLLVCQRPPEKRHGGLWEFPGGKTEQGETDEEAARRELREELAVQLTAVAEPLLEVRDPGSAFVIAFIPAQIDGEPTCHEHEALTWGTLPELSQLPLAPSDRVFIDWLCTLED